MGLLESGAGALQRIRLSRLIPRLDIGAEGTARLCTSDHLPWAFVGAPPRPPVDLHLDVALELWTKGQESVAVFELRDVRARGQGLVDGSPLGGSGFRALTLEPGDTKKVAYFQLSAPEGEELAAAEGDELTFSLRLGRNSRQRKVSLLIEARPGVKTARDLLPASSRPTSLVP